MILDPRVSEWIKQNWFKAGCLVIIGICLAYYFVILPSQKFQYQKQSDEQIAVQKQADEAAKEAKNKQNDSMRSFCLSLAQSSYMDRVKLNATSRDSFATWTWDSNSAREYVEGQLTADKNECYKQYPVSN